MADSITSFMVEKSYDQSTWTTLSASIAGTDRGYNHTETPPPPGNIIYYRLTGYTAEGVTIPYNVVNVRQQDGWIKGFNGGVVQRVRVAPDGNVWIAGYYLGVLDFSGGSDPLPDAGSTSYNLYLAKFTSQGDYVDSWAYEYFTSNSYAGLLKQMRIISDGSIYISGLFNNGVLLKFNSSGALQWVAGPVTDLSQTVCPADDLDVDPDGNVYICGKLRDATNGSHDFGGGHTITGTSAYVGYYAKYQEDGTCLRATKIATYSDSECAALAVDSSGSLFLTAFSIFGGIAMDGSTYYAKCGVLGKFDSDGNHLWSRAIGTNPTYGGPSANPWGMVLDPITSDLVMIGYYWLYSCEFGGNVGDAGNSLLYHYTTPCGYMARYSAAGNFIKAITIPTPRPLAQPLDLAIKSDRTILVSGIFRDSIQLGSVNLAGSLSAYDGFVVKFNSDMTALWGYGVLTPTGAANGTSIIGTDFDFNGKAVVAGLYRHDSLFMNKPMPSNPTDPSIFLARIDT